MLSRTLALLRWRAAPPRRGLWHAKHRPRGHYKGNRCRPTGWHTRKGGYVVDHRHKVASFEFPTVPDDFPLKPYVAIDLSKK
ncbi:hypothetical protein CDCA_CDCA10G2885 [Cyanidium caldarium]|uniref:Uncharacterized protein n=1 Tax=Cyanidium caldarium TaxID=2771 RepID=A0AAV9IXN4_CYACA|nr:hypothetical protein CDCA_CDCA10G2885 [Cyanidium caldarium]